MTTETISLEKITKTRITRHVFSYPTHVFVWLIYYGPLRGWNHAEFVSPHDTDMGLMRMCDIHFTMKDARESLQAWDEMTPRECFEVETIWH